MKTDNRTGFAACPVGCPGSWWRSRAGCGGGRMDGREVVAAIHLGQQANTWSFATSSCFKIACLRVEFRKTFSFNIFRGHL